MAIKLPTIAPKVNLPAAPKSSMTAFGTYPMIGQLKPMPAAVANNINLGWDYAKGQVIQPLTPAQKAQVYIPPFSPNIKTPTQPVIPPGGPAINTIKPGQPALPQQQFNWSVQTPVKIGGAPSTNPSPSSNSNLLNNLMNVASAPVKPQPLMPGTQAQQLKNTLSPLIPSKQAIATTQQNLAINQFLPKKATPIKPVVPERMVGLGRY